MNKSPTINKIEKTFSDTSTVDNGLIWYNTSENKLKSIIDSEIHTLLTDKNLTIVSSEFLKNNFLNISFENIDTINIIHNKNTVNFHYQLFDTVEQMSFFAQAKIISSNEIKFEFTETITGYVHIFFE